VKPTKKVRFAIVFLTCALILGLGACAQNHVPVSDISEPHEVLEPHLEDEPISVHLFGSFPYFSQEALMEESSLVVRGTVTNISSPFLIENIYKGGRAAFIDYSIEIHEILRGETELDEILVRAEGGGVVDGIAVTTDWHPDFEVGGQYLLFLTIPGGSPFCTPDEYYHILGGLQGMFSLTPDGARARSEEDMTFEQEVGSSEIVLGELRDEIEEVNAEVPPPDEVFFREQGEENMRRNAEGDVFIISDEELEKTLNRPWFPGRIVED